VIHSREDRYTKISSGRLEKRCIITRDFTFIFIFSCFDFARCCIHFHQQHPISLLAVPSLSHVEQHQLQAIYMAENQHSLLGVVLGWRSVLVFLLLGLDPTLSLVQTIEGNYGRHVALTTQSSYCQSASLCRGEEKVLEVRGVRGYYQCNDFYNTYS